MLHQRRQAVHKSAKQIHATLATIRHLPRKAARQAAETEETEEHVRALASSSCPKTLNINELSDTTAEDAVLARVKQALDGKISLQMPASGQATKKTG
ncbi:hypothetical protein NDU88_000932 [Pleurodeles waltl]|uniref:Uncharacterized protein n=1 Tax=Pleurodeles waltl TaxID=8319 RepID=A0AAV7VW42_PLEWA|nr:hypothetical protein NDU88_000932 [Pleurodeles waltl]